MKKEFNVFYFAIPTGSWERIAVNNFLYLMIVGIDPTINIKKTKEVINDRQS